MWLKVTCPALNRQRLNLLAFTFLTHTKNDSALLLPLPPHKTTREDLNSPELISLKEVALC